MPDIPRDPTPDASLALLRDGYAFITRRCRRLDSDVFVTRLALQDTICLRGEEAAELFYDRDRFVRAGAMPHPVRRTLIGDGGVQTRDGELHRERKALFMALLGREAVEDLAERFRTAWGNRLVGWAAQERVVLFEEAMPLLCRVVCDWAGVPLPEDEVSLRTNQMAAMIDGAGGVGARHVRGRLARRRAEAWASHLVGRVRRGDLEPPEGSALRRIALHMEPDGAWMSREDAAVELLNVIRPTVAVARFVAFAALALHHHASARTAVEEGGDEGLRAFVHEVRRYYPFFPFVAARVRDTFTWRGHTFPEGTRTLLDLYGTDRAPEIWGDPEAFRPERFLDREPSPYAFIPQGGGDHHLNHRCAGEWLTIALVRVATEMLTRRMTYVVPEQDLSIDLGRMPAIPRSRFVIRDVRPIGD